jgi:hypothetical protein
VSGRSQGEGDRSATGRRAAGLPPAAPSRIATEASPSVSRRGCAGAGSAGLGRCSRISTASVRMSSSAPHPRTPATAEPRRLSGYPAPGPGSCRGRYHTGRRPAPQAIRRVASALMAMEALVQPQHVKVGGRSYVAQFFDRATGDVLAGPVPDVPLDPAGRAVGRTASPPALQRLTRGQYELLPGDEEYRWPAVGGEGEAGATRAKTRPASLSLHRGMTSLHE